MAIKLVEHHHGSLPLSKLHVYMSGQSFTSDTSTCRR